MQKVQICNGTTYKLHTEKQIIDILEEARIKKIKIRIFYGFPTNGRDWMEEIDTYGYVSRTDDKTQSPILVKNFKTKVFHNIITDFILKITINKKTVYQHPLYYLPELRIMEHQNTSYAITTGENNDIIAIAFSHKQAEDYIKFFKGERNTI